MQLYIPAAALRGPIPAALLCLLASQGVLAQNVVSENDFLDDMPIVLSVSRLPQRLDETPGAVTLIDRDMIRRSGARDVADLLRLVPGFQTSSSFEVDAPQASYHGGFNNYSARIQVLVDGRSVYSTYFFGSVAPGLMSVAMQDIERIEVMRGSNSAAYGARAMLGVVNIVTRHAAATQGVQAQLTRGENGVLDVQAAVGWRSTNADYRFSASSRADDGLAGANGHNQVQRFSARSDWQTSSDDTVQLRAGFMTIGAGTGEAGNVDSPERDHFYESSFVQMDWQRTLNQDQDLALTLSRTQEIYRDSFPYSLQPYINDSIAIKSDGQTLNDSATLQHTFRYDRQLRVVWGAEWRREQMDSVTLFNTHTPLVTDFKRLFSNAEWRIKQNLLLNAGFMVEHHSEMGVSTAPRLMLNWQVLPGHTLRAGIARSYRPPSLFELHSDVRFSYKNLPLKVVSLSRGEIQSESVLTRELGYLADLPQWRADLDVRVFQEQLSGFVRRRQYSLPAGSSLLASRPWDYYDGETFEIQGFEYQFNWRPWRTARLGFNQTHSRISFLTPTIDMGTAFAVPDVASSLFFSQDLPFDMSLTLMHQDTGTSYLQGSSSNTRAMTRTDVRLGKTLRWGARRGELALVVQNTGLPYLDFDRTFEFKRRAFVTLRLDN